MARYRKKPIVIEAVQIVAADYVNGGWPDGSPFRESPAPTWLVDAVKEGVVVAVGIDADYAVFDIETLKGTMRAEPDDWIIRGIKGELYPCQSDIFAATYEAL